MTQGSLFDPQRPTVREIKELDPEYLYQKYREYYDMKKEEYDKQISKGSMKNENKISDELFQAVEDALLSQRYITARDDSNPHQYCLRKSWDGDMLFAKVAQTIRDYGYVEWFWRKPYMMLNVGEFKYWTMGWPLEVTVLINRRLLKPCTRAELLHYS
jgi:hypothetical protein